MGEVQDALKRVAAARLRCLVGGAVAGALARLAAAPPDAALELVGDSRDDERMPVASLADVEHSKLTAARPKDLRYF